MTMKLRAVEGIREKLGSFVETERIALEIVDRGDAEVSVAEPRERLESNVDLLNSGGFIACTTARALAKKLTISNREMGKLLDHLDIKIKKCELGCF